MPASGSSSPGAVLADQGVDQGGLAGVWTPHHGDAQGRLVGLFLIVLRFLVILRVDEVLGTAARTAS